MLTAMKLFEMLGIKKLQRPLNKQKVAFDLNLKKTIQKLHHQSKFLSAHYL